MNEKYKDIIYMMHHESKKHPRMSIEARSAQFAPFAALTGYEDLIEETGRFVESKIELNEDEKEILDNKLKIIYDKFEAENDVLLNITYFEKDKLKLGGKYLNYIGNLKKIDLYKKIFIFMDGNIIKIDDIKDIEICL